MDLRGLSSIVVIALAGPAAAEPTPTPEHPPAGLGARIAVGEAFASGVGDAWVARLEYELYPVLAPRHQAGPLFGFLIGAEYWRAGTGSSGFDLPAEVALGMRVFPVRVTVGVGADVFLVDQVRGDTGFGLWAPLASASAGVDVGGWNVMADVRVTRRWQFGADDFTQWMVTLGIGRTLETPPDRRARKPNIRTRDRSSYCRRRASGSSRCRASATTGDRARPAPDARAPWSPRRQPSDRWRCPFALRRCDELGEHARIAVGFDLDVDHGRPVTTAARARGSGK